MGCADFLQWPHAGVNLSYDESFDHSGTVIGTRTNDLSHAKFIFAAVESLSKVIVNCSVSGVVSTGTSTLSTSSPWSASRAPHLPSSLFRITRQFAAPGTAYML